MRQELSCGESDMNHPKVKPLTLQIAREIELDERLIELIFADTVPECFEYRIEPIEGSWTCNIPDEYDVAYPIWSCNGDQTLVCLKGKETHFIEGYHDDPEIKRVSRTTQGLLAYILLNWFEGDEPEDVQEAANACGFKHAELVIDYFEQDIEDFDAEEAKIIASVDAMYTSLDES